MNNRIVYLDYLRGIAAFGIMIYHYLTWSSNSHDIDQFINRIGVYGVGLFYVLSGLTLFHVYEKNMKFNYHDCFNFGIKRVFRIFPLLWLATFLTILITRPPLDIAKLLLNFTGLFGLFDWSSYYANGAWSIGNELVFYLFFPFFIFFRKSSKYLLLGLSLILLLIYLFFAFIILNENYSLGNQWKNYVNPLNQCFLFCGGFLVGHFFKYRYVKSNLALAIFILALFIFIFYPASGDSINIVTNMARIVFSISCFMFCFSFYKMNWELPFLMKKTLSFLGEASYSIYMLHGIIYLVVKKGVESFPYISHHYMITISITLTILISYFSYNYYEKYFMGLGAKFKLSHSKT